MAERLSPREAKHRTLEAAAETMRRAAAGFTNDHDGRLMAAAHEEVADELQRRADGYDRPRAARKPKGPDVDELLCRLWDMGVAKDTVIRSRPRRWNHGWHHIAWTHPDGHRGEAEGGTAELAVARAVKATEKRLRSNERRGRAA